MPTQDDITAARALLEQAERETDPEQECERIEEALILPARLRRDVGRRGGGRAGAREAFVRALAAVLVFLLAACAVLPGSGATEATVALLMQQAHDWDRAIVRKDRAAIESNMAEDFRQIDGAGNVETKKSFVDDAVAPGLTIVPYVVEDFEIRLYGDVALLSGRTRMTGRYDGRAFTTHYRYIDVYVKRDGRWKIASVQISKIPAA